MIATKEDIAEVQRQIEAFVMSNDYEQFRTIENSVREAPTQSALAVNSETVKVTDNSQMWAVSDDCYIPCEKSCEEMPANCYTINQSNERGIFFKQLPLNTDSLINLPDASTELILGQINKFWTKEMLYRQHGMLWKRGYLLHGPAGSGKTTTIQLVCQKIIKNNGIAFFITNPGLAAVGLSIFRKIELSRSLIVILEDLDAMIRTYGEANILALLDGEYQIDNVVYVATTNYPERLDLRLVNRPSRFDVVKYIGMPSAAARRMYLEHKSQTLKNKTNIEKWINDTDGLSIAHIKELIIAVDILECDYDTTIERLHDMADIPYSEENRPKKLEGFALK